ncbi:hypothetical protein [Pantoea agglomerans]|uniref:hypothetical protein n=1 Tax=Enterobacter agglomerans TaxID=549 RepID=UPI002412F1B4|nr:hypothetical protein [Pantoea agglomerans]
MSTWDDFNKLTTLSVVFPDQASAKGATIFGNGRNQVPVLVKMKATDKNGVALDINGAWLAAAVSLVSYSSGTPLSRDGGASTIEHWNVSDRPSEFTSPYSYNTQTQEVTLDDAGVSTLTLYVSAADIQAVSNIDIAVSLTVPGVGEFNTTAEGTDTKNGPGGKSGAVFKSPSYVHVSAILPVDYSDITLLNLTQTTWDTIGHQDYIVHDWKWDGVYYDKPNGAELARSTVTVTPKSSEFRFTAVSSDFTRYSAAEAVTSPPTWHHEEENGFDTYRNVTDKDTFIAVGGFGKSVDNPNYDAYLWYGPGENIEVSGHFHMIDSEWQYRAEISISDDHSAAPVSTEVIFSGYRIRVPTGDNTSHNGWDDVYGPISFTIMDNYGNTGTFKIGFFGNQSSYLTVGDVRLE